MAERAVQTVLFPTLFAKPLVATFDTPHQSSDGGAILLKAIDDALNLTAQLAACLPEWPPRAGFAHSACVGDPDRKIVVGRAQPRLHDHPLVGLRRER